VAYYTRFCRALADKGQLIPPEKLFDYVEHEKDCYYSIFLYNDEQLKKFRETGTVKGITDVVTHQIVWDFDSIPPLAAQEDAIILVRRLIALGISEKDIDIYFTGNKGFHISITSKEAVTPDEARNVAVGHLGEGLKTLDSSLYDAPQILRVPLTKHQTTNLYKIPITRDQLQSDIEVIKKLASSLDNIDLEKFQSNPIELPGDLFLPKKDAQSIKEISIFPELDWTLKPKFLSNCRWSLQNGNFQKGERNKALHCLAATYKNLGFGIEHVYRLLKGVAELQSKKFNDERFNDEELYNKIVMHVFSEGFRGGQYSCRDKDSWLGQYCIKLGAHSCVLTSKDRPGTISDISESFKGYVKNIEENTIKTGISGVDKRLFISTGSSVLIVGSSGSGKTSLALNILNNTSKINVKSVFASLDMSRTRMFEKIMYKISDLNRDSLYETFKRDQEKSLMDKLAKEFGNVFFFSKTCPTVEDLKNYVMDCQDSSGDKIKLVMIDYFERIVSDFTDDTQASKRVAGELQDMVEDLNICLMTLVQPNKMALAGGIDSPIRDYTKIKGSGFVYQSARQILSIWRPFCNPRDKMNDRFMQMAILKNDLGELDEFAFKWNGRRGEISELEQGEQDQLEALLVEKEKEREMHRENW